MDLHQMLGVLSVVKVGIRICKLKFKLWWINKIIHLFLYSRKVLLSYYIKYAQNLVKLEKIINMWYNIYVCIISTKG